MRCELRCPRCGFVSDDHNMMRCPRCGSPLVFKCHEVRLDVNSGYASMWRYVNMMAVKPARVVSYGEGLTPLVKIGEVMSKLETRNPTGSYADRASSAVVSNIVSDIYRVRYESDFAYSMAFYARLAGSAISVVADTQSLDPYDVVEIASLGGSIEFDAAPDLYYENPLSVEGLKTIAFELAEAQPRAEAVYVPSSSGLLAISVAEGLDELVGSPPLEVVAVIVKGSPTPSMLGLSKSIRMAEIEPEEVVKSQVRLAKRGIYMKFLAASAYSYAAVEGNGIALITGSLRRSLQRKTKVGGTTMLRSMIISLLSRRGGLTAYSIWKEMSQYTLRGVYSALRSLELSGTVCARYTMEGSRKVKVYELCDGQAGEQNLNT
ncbi:MAG: hypothetical protein RXO54_05435 [Acidilobus sp.]